jgi:hypothetical protein
VLSLEGEAAAGIKFIRQATDLDDNLQVVLLQRTAEATVNAPDKYLRLGVDGPEELAGGFPLKRDELFTYRSIILGTVEASAFTPEQQRMLEDFVDVRGGGLLALGGPRSFSEGGWAGTPLSEALPVVLDRGSRGPQYPPSELVVKPTRVGASHVDTNHGEGDAAAKWRDLPPVTSLNHCAKQAGDRAPRRGGARPRLGVRVSACGRGKRWRPCRTLAVADALRMDESTFHAAAPGAVARRRCAGS